MIYQLLNLFVFLNENPTQQKTLFVEGVWKKMRVSNDFVSQGLIKCTIFVCLFKVIFDFLL